MQQPMKKLLFSLFLLCPALWVSAQFPANFDTQDFSFTPFWQGDTSLFAIDNGLLQLADNNPASRNDTYLSVLAPTQSSTSTTWTLRVQLDFSPSSSNYARFYLAASTPDLTGSLTGYFVRIGGISGSDDALELYRQDGLDEILLASGTPGAVGNGPIDVRLTVSRDTSGTWSLAAAYGGGSSPALEATATDTTYPVGTYAGLRCLYTATRSTAFRFDDLDIQPLTVDTIPPRLSRITVQDSQQILAEFDEPVALSTLTLQTFTLQPNTGIADITPVSATEVVLDLSAPLQNASTYTLEARGVSDLAGNRQSVTDFSFEYLVGAMPRSGQLLITEFFANPSTDLINLPRAEFIELYNNSDDYLDLSTVRLASGGTPILLPEFILTPGAYLVLADTEAAPALADFGPTLDVPSLPTLSNGGDVILLENTAGQTLQELVYTTDWLTGQAAAGLATLERIALELPVDCPGNWIGSPAAQGGTPGQENATGPSDLETTPPTLFSVRPLSTFEIAVRFSEPVDAAQATDPTRYRLTGNLAIASIVPAQEEFILILDEDLQAGTVYSLTVSGLSDCLGNQTPAPLVTSFGLAEPAQPGDLLINEVLFHPQPGGEDFVELYNASAKIIDLEGLVIRNEQKTTGAIQSRITTGYLLFPGAYVALTGNPEDIRTRYPLPDTAVLLANDLPTLEADAGNVTLYRGTTVLDAFDYSEELHNALLDNERGVSLERLSPMLPTQANGNWHSAAQQTGFATPGYRNSQFFPQGERGTSVFNLAQRTFSPDGDGFEDVLLLDYQTSRSGYLASVRIFDATGRPVRELARNELLASEGRLKWDGSRDNGERARTGLYLLWIELFTPEGDRQVVKEYCVLASRF